MARPRSNNYSLKAVCRVCGRKWYNDFCTKCRVKAGLFDSEYARDIRGQHPPPRDIEELLSYYETRAEAKLPLFDSQPWKAVDK